jgi:hypothetical protein
MTFGILRFSSEARGEVVNSMHGFNETENALRVHGKLIGILLLLILQGCVNDVDQQAYSKMSSTFIAIRLYDESFGYLPSPNANTWKHSMDTRFKTVTWRVLVMDRIATYESHHAMDQARLEASILSCAEANFRIGARVIYSNFAKLGTTSLSSLPKYTILAMTVISPADYSCIDDEPYELWEVHRGVKDFTLAKDWTYILFANGTVGKIKGKISRELDLLLDPGTSNMYDEANINAIGIHILRRD